MLILAVSLRTLAVVIVIVIITAVVLIIVVVIVPALVVVLSRLETAALIVVLIVVIVVPAVIVIVIIVRVTLLPVVIVHLPALLIIITAALIVILIRGIVIIAAVISGSGLLLSGGIGILNRIGVRHRRRRIDISGGNRFGSRSIGVIGIVLRRAEGNRPDRFRGNDQQIRLGIFEKGILFGFAGLRFPAGFGIVFSAGTGRSRRIAFLHGIRSVFRRNRSGLFHGRRICRRLLLCRILCGRVTVFRLNRSGCLCACFSLFRCAFLHREAPAWVEYFR